jgi:hypothetical protein
MQVHYSYLKGVSVHSVKSKLPEGCNTTIILIGLGSVQMILSDGYNYGSYMRNAAIVEMDALLQNTCFMPVLRR